MCSSLVYWMVVLCQRGFGVCNEADMAHRLFFLPVVCCSRAWQKEELSIAGYGVSVTTLEEVFLRVGHGSEEVRSPLLALLFTPQLVVLPFVLNMVRG